MLNNFFIIFLIPYFLLQSGCVSVEVEEPKAEKAENIKFINPKGYENYDNSPLDQAWKNNINGNSISFLSECGNANDPSLEKIREGIISNLGSTKIVSENSLMFNGRNALNSTVASSIDGVDTKLEILIFKKNSCIYVITYVALAPSFEEDFDIFQTFLREFKAP
jgi:hypothetical protein